MYGDLDRVVRPDLHYHYSTPVCAHRWLAVCDDAAYGHRALLERVDRELPSLIAALRGDRGAVDPLSVVSLGPGDGALDEMMLRALDATRSSSKSISASTSRSNCSAGPRTAGACAGLARAFPIRAVCGDFRGVDASSLSTPARVSRLFSLTGFTLGNYDENALLTQISRLMRRPGDYLLLDARLTSTRGVARTRVLSDAERRATVDGYDLRSVREFVFGPVEVATLATARRRALPFRHQPAR